MTCVASVELCLFRFELEGIGLPPHGAAGVGNLIAKKGSRMPAQRWAVRIERTTARGASTSHIGSVRRPHSLKRRCSPRIWSAAILTNARKSGRICGARSGPTITWGMVLWTSRCGILQVSAATFPSPGSLADFRTRLPTYASSYHGQEEPGGLDTPRAFADYAAACRAQGFAGFKIHGWHTGDAAREATTVLAVRKAVGDGWPLMLDPASQLRTWRDALYVGEACR